MTISLFLPEGGDPILFPTPKFVKLSALQPRLNALLVSLRARNGGFEYPPLEDGRFGIEGDDLPAGAYDIVTARLSHSNSNNVSTTPGLPLLLPVSTMDISRAFVATRAIVTEPRHSLSDAQSLANLLDDYADFGAVALSVPDAVVRLLVTVSPEVVTVAIDASRLTRQLLAPSAPPAPYKSGRLHALALEISQTIPIQTLLQLCTDSHLLDNHACYDLISDHQSSIAKDRVQSADTKQPPSSTGDLPSAVSSITPTSSGSSSRGFGARAVAAFRSVIHHESSSPSSSSSSTSAAPTGSSQSHGSGAAASSAATTAAPSSPTHLVADDIHENTHRRLLFTGTSLSGMVAHTAALLARDAAQSRDITVRCVTFGAPFFASSEIGAHVDTACDTSADAHVNVCHRDDAAIAAINLCMRAHHAQLVSGDTSFNVAQLADAVTTLIGDASDASLARAFDMYTQMRPEALRLIETNLPSDAGAHSPVGWFSFRSHDSDPSDSDTVSSTTATNATLTTLATSSATNVISTTAAAALAHTANVGAHSVPTMATATSPPPALLSNNAPINLVLEDDCERMIESVAILKRNLRRHRTLAWSPELCQKISWRYSCEVSPLQLLTRPRIDRVEIVQTPVRADVVVTGLGLEPLLRRADEPASLILDETAFDLTDGNVILVSRATTTDVRFSVLGCRYLSEGTVQVRTLFGETPLFTVAPKQVRFVDDVSPSAMMHARVDAELLRTVFLRGLISLSCVQQRQQQRNITGLNLSSALPRSSLSSPSPTSSPSVSRNTSCNSNAAWLASHELLALLCDLEQHLCGKTQLRAHLDDFAARCAASDDPDVAATSSTHLIKPANRIITSIVARLTEPLVIEYHSTVGRALRKIFGGLGVVTGSVLSIVGALALLPGFFLMSPGLRQIMRRNGDSTDENGASFSMSTGAGLLFLPGAIASLPGAAVLGAGMMIVSASRRGLTDRTTQQYSQILRLLITMLGGDPSLVLDEVPSLEVALATAYTTASGGGTLATATEKDVARVLDSLAKGRRRNAPSSSSLTAGGAGSGSGTGSSGGGGGGGGASSSPQHSSHAPHQQLLSSSVSPLATSQSPSMVTAIEPIISFFPSPSPQRSLNDAVTGTPPANTSDATNTSGNGRAASPTSSMRSSSPPPAAPAEVPSNIQGIRCYSTAQSESRTKLRQWLVTAGRLSRMRRVLERQIVVGFVGVHNSGKSTFVSRLFGVDADTDILRRTEYPQLYNVFGGGDASRMHISSASSDVPVTLDVIDFPGSTDQRQHTAHMTERFAGAATLFVCVFAAGHIAEPERRVVSMAKLAGRDFVVLVNKADAIRHELAVREESIRDSYASVLGVSRDLIFFVSAHESSSLAVVRAILWKAMRFLLPDEQATLAFAILPRTLREQLVDTHGGHSEHLTSAVTSLLDNMHEVDAQAVSTRIAAMLSREEAEARDAAASAAAAREATLAATSAAAAAAAAQSTTTQTIPAQLADNLVSMGFPPSLVVAVLQSMQLQQYHQVLEAVQHQTRQQLSSFLQTTNQDQQRHSSTTPSAETTTTPEVSSDPVTAAVPANAAAAPSAVARASPYLGLLSLLVDPDALQAAQINVQNAALDILGEAMRLREMALDPAQLPRLVSSSMPALSSLSPSPSATASVSSSAGVPAVTEELVDRALFEVLKKTPSAIRSRSFETLFAEMLAHELRSVSASSADGSAAAAAAAAQTSTLNNAITGIQLLGSLRLGVRFRHVRPPHRGVREVYPDFDNTMSFEQRVALFHAHLKKLGLGHGSEAQMLVDPSNVLESTISSLSSVDDIKLLRSVMRVKLTVGTAVDVNGVLRSVMTSCATAIREGKQSCFAVSDDGHVYFGGPMAHRDATQVAQVYRAVGRMVGLVLGQRQARATFPANFSLPIFKLILGQQLTMDDLDLVDSGLCSSIKQVCMMDSASVADLDLRFCVDLPVLTETSTTTTNTYDLVKGGAEVPVSAGNRLGYLERRVRFHLGMDLPLDLFVAGVADCVPRELLTVFTPEQLMILVNGRPTVSASELRAGMRVGSTAPAAHILEWFWEVLEEMSDDQRALLLVFMTGSPSLPPGGCAALRPPLTITRSSREGSASLPTAHTCFNRLDLPAYESKEALKNGLEWALGGCSAADFGFL